jgi:four helix bundle protein
MRRSSRSISINSAKPYRKRRYPSYFINRDTDSDTENSETNVWLEYTLNLECISKTSLL